MSRVLLVHTRAAFCAIFIRFTRGTLLRTHAVGFWLQILANICDFISFSLDIQGHTRFSLCTRLCFCIANIFVIIHACRQEMVRYSQQLDRKGNPAGDDPSKGASMEQHCAWYRLFGVMHLVIIFCGVLFSALVYSSVFSFSMLASCAHDLL